MSILPFKSNIGKLKDIYDELWPKFQKSRNTEETRYKLIIDLVDSFQKEGIKCKRIQCDESNNKLKKTINVYLHIYWYALIRGEKHGGVYYDEEVELTFGKNKTEI